VTQQKVNSLSLIVVAPAIKVVGHKVPTVMFGAHTTPPVVIHIYVELLTRKPIGELEVVPILPEVDSAFHSIVLLFRII
jgi:hypothetical protein